jgi:hypothetical protein
MASSRHSKDCETSHYRHGCDRPQETPSCSSLRPQGSTPDLANFKAIPHSINRVTAIRLGLTLSFSFKAKEVRKEMPAATLTTTLSELNRLYGVYFEVVNEKRSSSQEAQRAWTDYEAYATRYKKERSIGEQ